MPDPVTTTISSVKLVIDGIKYLKNVDDKWQVADIKNKAADLLCSLADIKISLTEYKELLADKDKEINELKEAMKLKCELIKHADAYYEKNENGKASGDLFCLRCFENTSPRAVHLIFHKGKDIYYNGWICPLCKTIYDFHSANRIEKKK
jgi:hypothetical protein